MRRLFAIGLAAFLALGCSGAVNGLAGLAGVEMDFQQGAAAKHPANIPVGVPSSGAPEISMGMTAPAGALNMPDDVEIELPPDGTFRMELITYKGVDLAVEGPKARAALEADGWVKQVPNPEQAASVDNPAQTWKKGDRVLALILNDHEESSMGIVLVEPRPAAAAP